MQNFRKQVIDNTHYKLHLIKSFKSNWNVKPVVRGEKKKWYNNVSRPFARKKSVKDLEGHKWESRLKTVDSVISSLTKRICKYPQIYGD